MLHSKKKPSISCEERLESIAEKIELEVISSQLIQSSTDNIELKKPKRNNILLQEIDQKGR